MESFEVEFQFIGFTPREAFRKAANEEIKKLLEIMPREASCSARVVMIDSKFFFQVMFVSRTECFIAKEVLDPKKEDTSSRCWQAVGIQRVAKTLSEQIMSWRQSSQQAA